MLGVNVPKVLVRGEQAKAIREAAARSVNSCNKPKHTSSTRWTFKMKENYAF